MINNITLLETWIGYGSAMTFMAIHDESDGKNDIAVSLEHISKFSILISLQSSLYRYYSMVPWNFHILCNALHETHNIVEPWNWN